MIATLLVFGLLLQILSDLLRNIVYYACPVSTIPILVPLLFYTALSMWRWRELHWRSNKLGEGLREGPGGEVWYRPMTAPCMHVYFSVVVFYTSAYWRVVAEVEEVEECCRIPTNFSGGTGFRFCYVNMTKPLNPVPPENHSYILYLVLVSTLMLEPSASQNIENCWRLF